MTLPPPASRRLRLDDLHRFALPEQPALHPDGARVAYVLRTDDRDSDTVVRNLWLVTADRQARQVTRGTADAAPTWSPDGRWLAFLRAGDGPAQLWLLPAEGGEPEQLTTLPLGAGTPAWSPDGTRIAFSAPVDAAGPDAPVATDRLEYKVDGGGLLRGARKHLHVLDLATRAVTRLTRGDWHAGDPVWSPDGTRLAFPAARDPDADLTLRSAVYTLEPGGAPQLVGSAEGVAGPVCWTAGGEALLVVGRAHARIGHNRLLRVAVDGGGTVDLTASLDRNVMPGAPGYPGALPQLVDGETVLVCVRDRGCTHLYAVPVGGGEPRLVVGGAGRTVAGLSVAGSRAALVLATPTSTGEVALLDGAECRPLTNHGGLDGVELFVHEEREFDISDGTTVHGWLLRDPDRPGPYPLLLDVHGGPHNAWNAAADPVHLYHQLLAAEGWAVLLLNPRGSDGYGEEFFTAVVGAWGEADAADLLEPIERLVAEGVADPARLAVAGYSYGGFMTCYLTAHDDRFAAAVAGGVVSDLTSLVGTSDVGRYLGAWEVGAPPWSDPSRYDRLSPLSAVDRVRTPTLVLHGAADERCPAGQAEQWFTALREREVPAQLVLYPGSSHLFLLDGRPSHRFDLNRRIVQWVQRHANHRPPIDGEHWRRRLVELTEKYRVPGAALGILRLGAPDDEVVVASCGVLNKATGVAATDDSLFQIGSITKVYTATLVMRLVEEGLLGLDTPVAELLPELSLADPEVTKQVTMRHLLTHTSGIDGDIFTNTGRGDDCLERYVGLLADAAQNHPVGATFSYCNSGFVLAGRIIEKLTGATWDAALRDRLLDPLGLTHTVTLPEQALRFRTAMGHLAEGDAEPVPAPVWELPRSSGPAGAICASAAEVLAFARLHLTGGVAPDGTRLLAEATVADMADRHAELPDRHSLGDSWGLGWIRFGWDGHRLVGHDGNTLGQSAFLRMLPAAGLAVTLLTNGGHTRDLYQELYQEIFAELAGVAMPEPVAPATNPPTVDGTRHVGVYERASIRLDVLERPGGLRLRSTITGPLADLVPDPVEEHDLVPVGEDRYVLRPPGGATWVPVTFYALPTGEAYVHYGVRATPRIR